MMDWQGLAHSVLETLDMSSGFNLRLVSLMLLLAVIGEAYIMVPLLIESIWLVASYGVSVNPNASSVLNLSSAFLATQLGRQTGISALYLLFSAVNTPLSPVYMKYLRGNRYYEKYREKQHFYDMKFLSLPSATLGMLTALNSPIKMLLIARRRLRVLLIGTLLSGMAFDATYIVLGVVFRATTLKLTYLPVFLLVGFLAFVLLRAKVLR